jgi:hypothetical protein
VDYGNEFVEHAEPSEWGPLVDLDRAYSVYAANRLWLGPSVVSAFDDVLSQLGLGASAALSMHGSPELENVAESMSRSIIKAAEACEQVVQSALGLPALESVHERLLQRSKPGS